MRTFSIWQCGSLFGTYLVLWQYEGFESLFGESDVLHRVDEEVEPDLLFQGVAADKGYAKHLVLIRQWWSGLGLLLLFEEAISGHSSVIVVDWVAEDLVLAIRDPDSVGEHGGRHTWGWHDTWC